MKKWQFVIIGLLLVGCSNKKSESITSNERKAELKQLLRRGYSIEELQLRTGCPSSYLYATLSGEPIPKEYHHIFDSIYNLDKEDKLISASKLGLSAKECIQKIFVKAQNLPITSQYTGIDAVSICHELTNKTPLEIEDSLKAMIAYIDNSYGYAEIPTNINVLPYFRDYYNEYGIQNIKLPIDYSQRFSGANATQQAMLSYFVKQAEDFELEANRNLEKNINKKIEDFIANVTKNFIENDVNSKINAAKVYFDSKEGREKFYLEKLNKRIHNANLDSLLRAEVINYCISINYSRELAVNEMLGYKENIDNMGIASNLKYDKYFTKIKGIDDVYNEQTSILKSTAFMCFDIALFFNPLTQSASIPVGAVRMFRVIKNSPSLFRTVKNSSSLIFNAVQKKLSEDKVDIKSEDLNTYLKENIRQSIMDYLNKDKEGYFKEALDDNTNSFYEMLRNDFAIK